MKRPAGKSVSTVR